MDGLSKCSRYAFGPNRLHMCGPDMSGEVLAYIDEGTSDMGLTNIIQAFSTLYPYLRQIASANNIVDPFDKQVVEAYWLGNRLLDSIPPKIFYRHLADNLKIKKQIGIKDFRHLVSKLDNGALMHHSFHVFNVWNRTGHLNEVHTLDSMDNCRVSWGEVVSVIGPKVKVNRQPITILDGKLSLNKPQETNVVRKLDDSTVLDEVRVGDIISIHWTVACEVLKPYQLANLQKYTALSLKLANLTI